jgi:sugar phosphate isomerase/epimerase
LCKRLSDKEAVSLIKNAGFDAVDMSYCSFEHPSLADNYKEIATTLRAHLDTIGLECNQAHAPFQIKFDEALTLDNPHYLAICRAIRSAAILGAKNIVVHSVNVPEDSGIGCIEYNLGFYRSFIPLLRECGIRIAVETLFSRDPKRPRFNGRICTPSKMNAFISELGTEHFTGCLDVGHVALCGMEPESFIKRMDPDLVECLHVQDGDYIDDRHQPPFLGSFNWDKITEALANVGYRGDLTLEVTKYATEMPKDLLPDAYAMLAGIGRRLIKMIDAAKISEGT